MQLHRLIPNCVSEVVLRGTFMPYHCTYDLSGLLHATNAVKGIKNIVITASINALATYLGEQKERVKLKRETWQNIFLTLITYLVCYAIYVCRLSCSDIWEPEYALSVTVCLVLVWAQAKSLLWQVSTFVSMLPKRFCLRPANRNSAVTRANSNFSVSIKRQFNHLVSILVLDIGKKERLGATSSAKNWMFWISTEHKAEQIGFWTQRSHSVYLIQRSL